VGQKDPYRGRQCPQPAPVQVHDPFGQLVNEQCAPVSHCSVQLPLEQSTVHVEPLAHAVRHDPLEQVIVHVAPAGHEVLQWPEPQSTEHVPSPQ
jgi:hypothetical protein